MKKINILAIAALLIAVHAAVFLFVIGAKNNDSGSAGMSGNEQPTESDTPATGGNDVQSLDLDDLLGLTPSPGPTPSPDPTPDRPTSGQSIAQPVNRDGYLRSDLANRRTSRVYDKLARDPYQGAIVVDARTGKILYQNRATSYAYPASVTKLMTTLIVLEQIDAGKIRLSDKVQITREGAGVGGSQAYLDVRESGLFSVEDMLKAVMIHSANDAAAVLAIHVAGSRDAFVELMNLKARELGMNATTYHSPHGLPPGGAAQPDISTAHDIALLSMAIMRHPLAMRYSSTRLDYLPASAMRADPRFMLSNRNSMVEGAKESYEGCDGLKTGYHSAGGWSISITAERNGKRVLAVVLGCPDKNTRNTTARQLLDKGFQALEQQ